MPKEVNTVSKEVPKPLYPTSDAKGTDEIPQYTKPLLVSLTDLESSKETNFH